MKTTEEAACLSTFLRMLAEEKEIPVNVLAKPTGIPAERVNAILQGILSPTLEELIMLGNELGVKLSFHATVPFAHQKIVNKMSHDHAG